MEFFLFNRDFQKTLKEDQYPTTTLSFSNVRKSNEGFLCDLKLNIVGKDCIFKDVRLFQNKKIIWAELILSMKSLDLEPFSRLGIKMKDVVELCFEADYKTY